jgi:hypothetical protein
MPKCPSCKMVLSTREADAEACPMCHAPMNRPARDRSNSSPAPTSGPTRPADAPVARSASVAPRRATFGGYLTVMAFAVLGIAVTLILNSGRTSWIWLGGGIGAGMGVVIAQAAGMWPRKEHE